MFLHFIYRPRSMDALLYTYMLGQLELFYNRALI